MTDGHKHRTLRVRKDGIRYGVLTKPRRHITVVPGTPAYWALEKSPYPYGPCGAHRWTPDRQCYYLSLLSILHRWTGLTLYFEDETEGDVRHD